MNDCTHEGKHTWDTHDARGIYLARVCTKCVKARLAQYRPEVLTDPNYEADEPIEPEPGVVPSR